MNTRTQIDQADKWTLEDFIYDKFLQTYKNDKYILKQMYQFKFLIDEAILDLCNDSDDRNGFNLALSMTRKDVKYTIKILQANDTTAKLITERGHCCYSAQQAIGFDILLNLFVEPRAKGIPGFFDVDFLALLCCFYKFMATHSFSLYNEAIETIKKLSGVSKMVGYVHMQNID